MKTIAAIILCLLFYFSTEAKENSARIIVGSDYLSDSDTLEVYIWDDMIGSKFVTPFRKIRTVQHNGQYVFEIGNIRSSAITSLCFSYQKLKGIPAYCIFDQLYIYGGDEVFIKLVPRQGTYVSSSYDNMGLPVFKNNWHCSFYKGRGAERMALNHRLLMLIDEEVPYNPRVGNSVLAQTNHQLQRHDEKWNNIQRLLQEEKGNISSLESRQLYWDCLGRIRLLQVSILKKRVALHARDADIQSRVTDVLNPLLTEVKAIIIENDTLTAQSPVLIQYWNNLFSLSTRIKMGEHLLRPIIAHVMETFPKGKARDRLLTNLMIDRFIHQPDIKLLGDLLLIVDDPASQTRLEGLAVLLKGKPFPQFDLPDISGKRYMLSDLKGKDVLIDFWYMGCVPCRTYMENVIEPFCEMYSEVNNVQVLLISLDDKNTLRKAMESGIIPQGALALYTDDLKFQHPLLKVLGIKSYPFPILLNSKGYIVTSGKELKTIEGIRKFLIR